MFFFLLIHNVVQYSLIVCMMYLGCFLVIIMFVFKLEVVEKKKYIYMLINLINNDIPKNKIK